MFYLFDPITCQKQETTYDLLEGITGISKVTLATYKSRKLKIACINCYLIDGKTSNSDLRNFLEKEVIKDECWVDIPGSHNQVSNYGRYRTMLKSGPKMMLVYNRGKNRAEITLTINGKKEKLVAATKVAEMFLDKPKGNVVLTHKTGNSFNNRAENLEYIPKIKHHKASGALAKSIPIAKVDIETGEILEEYTSMRRAAAKNFLKGQSISLAIIENRLCAGMKFVKILD